MNHWLGKIKNWNLLLYLYHNKNTLVKNYNLVKKLWYSLYSLNKEIFKANLALKTKNKGCFRSSL